MIVGVGIDVVEVERVADLLARFPERAPDKLFTPAERAWCDRRPRSAECYAARFAAKEAFLKALGEGLAAGIPWTEIEVRSDAAGRPRLALAGGARARHRDLGGGRIHLSLSHDGGIAAAIVLLEGAEPSARGHAPA